MTLIRPPHYSGQVPNIAKVYFMTSLLRPINGGDGGRLGGSWPPTLYGTLFARKDRDTLIEQSGSGYSNRAVTVFREAV